MFVSSWEAWLFGTQLCPCSFLVFLMLFREQRHYKNVGFDPAFQNPVLGGMYFFWTSWEITGFWRPTLEFCPFAYLDTRSPLLSLVELGEVHRGSLLSMLLFRSLWKKMAEVITNIHNELVAVPTRSLNTTQRIIVCSYWGFCFTVISSILSASFRLPSIPGEKALSWNWW